MNVLQIRIATLLGVTAFGLAGCGQSFNEGMRIICMSPVEAKTKEPVEAARWIDQNLKNAEARRVFDDLARYEVAEKGQKAREAAAKAGINQCPLADLWATAAPAQPADPTQPGTPAPAAAN